MPTLHHPPGTAEALSRLVRKVAPRSVKEALAGLDAIGIRAEPIKEDRAIVGYTLHLPAGAPVSSLTILKPANYIRFSPEALWFGYYDREPATLAALEWMRQAALAIVGQTDPALALAKAREQQGLPAQPRSKDPAVRTCGACFRDIKATATDPLGRGAIGKRGPQHYLIVDHGYSIDPGWRSGACWGVGRLPLEESPEALQLGLDDRINYAERVRQRVHQLTDALRNPAKAKALGPRQVETGRQERDPATHKRREVLVSVGPDDPRWYRSVQIEHDDLQRRLRASWSGGFESIPWFCAALREWTPQAPDVTPPKGAPLVTLRPTDFAGRPCEAGAR